MGVKRITRTIQWYGLLRFPQLNQGERIHWWRLIADMRRRPTGEYRNDGIWQPPRGFWGNVCLRRDGRVIGHRQLEFPNQIVFEVAYTEDFLYQSISCSLDAVLKSFENLGVALNLIPIARINPIKEWNPYALYPSDISIKMIAENAIADFVLEYDLLSICAVNGIELPPPVEPPKPKPEEDPVSPGDDFEEPISPPYEGRDDNGETYDPDPEPDEIEYPIGSDCDVYRIDILYWMDGEDLRGPGTPSYALFYAPIEAIFLGKYEESDQTKSVVVVSAGRTDIHSCSPGQRSTIVLNNVAAFQIVSISEV